MEKQEERLSTIIKDILAGMSSLFRHEMQLAVAELKSSVKDTGRLAVSTVIYAGALLFGAFAFLSFAIIGLGSLINHNYWLSSLIVSVVLVIPGAIGLVAAFRRAELDFTFRRTQNSLEQDQELIGRKIVELTQTPRPTVAHVTEITELTSEERKAS